MKTFKVLTGNKKKKGKKKLTRKEILRQRYKTRKDQFDKEDLEILAFKDSLKKQDKEFKALLQQLMGELDD